MVSLFLGAVLVLSLVRKLVQSLRAPDDRLLRSVTCCLLCALLTFSLGLPVSTRLVDGAIGAGSAKLLQNVLLLSTLYWLVCFYLHSATDPDTGRRRARLELVPLGLTAAVITLAMVTTPPHERDHSFTTAHMQAPEIAVFYCAAGLYLCYALAMALWWTWRYARLSTGPLAHGLWVLAVSLASMVGASALREGMVVTRWLGGTVPLPLTLVTKHLLETVAVPLFIIGLLYPGIVNRCSMVRLWWRHRRLYRRLAPLWTALHEAFPEDAFTRADRGWRRVTHGWTGIHHRYYRRVIECRDGLVRLSPHLTEFEALSSATDDLPREVIAGHLRAALRAHAESEPAPSRAVPIARPSGDSVTDDVRQLVTLSDALAVR
ncbi:MAB_1171c family putative transporter [Streptomyces silaceus]|uniref:MAB_1171c family putative transporter n=1 Tax=Streptomyces silaceus TaxID=545123 RepID=UPI0006EBBE63|nr:MAB_1171c family putative transporter [Streptomyces silaceus]